VTHHETIKVDQRTVLVDNKLKRRNEVIKTCPNNSSDDLRILEDCLRLPFHFSGLHET
jgi:hypothetical protein